jgi:hypothetical protein
MVTYLASTRPILNGDRRKTTDGTRESIAGLKLPKTKSTPLPDRDNMQRIGKRHHHEKEQTPQGRKEVLNHAGQS